jgi:hypothetical protein
VVAASQLQEGNLGCLHVSVGCWIFCPEFARQAEKRQNRKPQNGSPASGAATDECAANQARETCRRIRLGCAVCRTHYDSAFDYPPAVFAVNHPIQVNLQERAMYVSRETRMGISNHRRAKDVSCMASK